MAKIKFRNISDVNKFTKIVSKYDSDVNIIDGSTVIDGESIIGIMALGINKTFEVEFVSNDSTQEVMFMQEIEKLGIVRG